ncbi:unnamed protein product, partial [Prorocentrum cordatum]
PPPPPCFNRDPGTNPSVGSVATRVRRVRARLTSALYTPTACGQRPLTQAGGGQGKFRTRLSGLAPPSGPNRRTTMHSYSAERFNDDKNKKTQSVVTALGLASGPQEEGGGGGGGGRERERERERAARALALGTFGGAFRTGAARLQHAPLGLPRPRAGALSGRPASCPRARASQRGGQGARRGRAGKRPRMGGGTPPRSSSKDAWAWIASRTGRQITPAWPGRRPRARRGPLARREPAAGDLGDAGEHRAEDAVQQACGERADGEGLEAEPAPPRGWRGPLQHHLGRTSRSRHAPPRGAARPGEGGGGTVRGAPAAA